MSDVVLIPCARLVPLELQVEFGPVPSGMVPLRGRPALEHICASRIATGAPVLLALHDGAEEVRTWLARQNELEPTVIDVGETRYLGETVLVSLDALPQGPERVVIHFADTLVDGAIPDGDFVLSRCQADTFRYTTFAVDAATGALEVTSEKQEDVASATPQPVFVGVFGVVDVGRFRDLLRAAVDVGAVGGVDPFYLALTEYSRDPGRDVAAHEVETWHDFGHLDTYYETKRSLFLGARAFNSVAVDSSRGVIRKSSNNRAKFLDEVLWYLRLPQRLKHVAPRILDYSLDPVDPWVEMEFYGYPALNDAYLIGQWDIGVWRRVLAALSSLVKEMQSHRYQPVDPAALTEAATSMYVTKTLDRLAELRAKRPDWLAPYLGETVRVNGRTVRGVAALERELGDLLDGAGLLSLDSLAVIHGDLCLSNLLYDRRSGIVRTIDPRGRFGSFDVYGDPVYDLAKLSHSFHGDYDLILAGRFAVEVLGDDRRLTVHVAEGQRRIKTLFDGWLAGSWSDKLTQVRLVEALLFVSMAPLHADNERAQEAFLIRGLELFDEAIAGA